MKKIFLAFLGLILVSCGTINLPTLNKNKENTSLKGSEWVLDDQNLSPNTHITLHIEEGKVSGNGGCNQYFGQLTMDNAEQSFSVKSIGATRMHCENSSTENQYFNLLEKVDKFEVKDQTLELYKGGVLLLKFKKK